MTELLFILTTIFVAYVVYVIIHEQQAMMKSATSEKLKGMGEVVAEQPKQQEVKAKTEPTPITQPVRVAPNSSKSSVRDPKTGEVTALTSNYRFMKRWVKEALVVEGLLEKVYKNNEIDAGAEDLIKEALSKLGAMDKYRA
jgi:hypothetical protein